MGVGGFLWIEFAEPLASGEIVKVEGEPGGGADGGDDEEAEWDAGDAVVEVQGFQGAGKGPHEWDLEDVEGIREVAEEAAGLVKVWRLLVVGAENEDERENGGDGE